MQLTVLAALMASFQAMSQVQLRPAGTIATLTGCPLPDGCTQAIPCATDWDGDGKTDLLVGYRPDDKVAFFKNTGTPGNPALTRTGNVQAGGVDLVVSGGG